MPSHHLKPLKVCENLRAATSREALLTKKSPRPPDFQGDISKIVYIEKYSILYRYRYIIQWQATFGNV